MNFWVKIELQYKCLRKVSKHVLSIYVYKKFVFKNKQKKNILQKEKEKEKEKGIKKYT